MRILFFTDHFKPEPSAPAAHVHERAKLWVKWGHQVTVICSAPNFPVGEVYPGYKNSWRHIEGIDGIRVVRVKTFITKNEGFFLRTLDYISYMLSAFFFAFFEKRPDVAISTSPHLFAAAGGTAHCKLRGIPHIFEIRDLWPASIATIAGMKKGRSYRILEALELCLYRNSKRILALVPSFLGDLVSRGVPASKIDVVINGANLELFSPRPPDLELQETYGLKDRFVVGYLGTIGLAHGLENVIEAAKILRDKPVTFLFVGVGAGLEQLQKAAVESGLQNIVFVGRQLKEDMPRFWSICDASLIHLKNDPLFEGAIPSKIFESMACGLPILYVGPKSEGTAIVQKHNAGLHVAPANPMALVAAIERLFSNEQLAAELRSNSLAAAPLYSREAQALGTLAVFKKALNPNA
jgi:colanic acid biosynthesis glycosyl transferase WcaI